MKRLSWLPLLLAMSVFPVYAANDTSTTADATYSVPDAAETATLRYMREEEKLARDVYRHLFVTWNDRVFANISESEQQHTDQVAAMLDKYRIPDPALQELEGVFVNPTLQALYNELVARGDTSHLAGLKVGALIEETDMRDLTRAIDESDQADLDSLYSNLMQGSRNHLRAFVSRIEALGVPYTAQVLSQDEVDAIVDSPIERGHR